MLQFLYMYDFYECVYFKVSVLEDFIYEYLYFVLKLYLNLIGIFVYIYNLFMLSLLKELYEYCYFVEMNLNFVCRKCQDVKLIL